MCFGVFREFRGFRDSEDAIIKIAYYKLSGSSIQSAKIFGFNYFRVGYYSFFIIHFNRVIFLVE